MVDFFSALNQFIGLQTGEDTFWLHGKSKGSDRGNAAYHLMNSPTSRFIIGHGSKFGKPESCFVRLLVREVVFTLDNLMKRGMPLCSGCFMCKENAET